jgi:chromosome condensin MukBEF complex kleisin-like MukF subunit
MCLDTAPSDTRVEALELERSKLQVEVATLQSKLEMQQHHSGGLGAAMLQERLEAQQRRITALELGKKVRDAQFSRYNKCGLFWTVPIVLEQAVA